MVCVRPGLGNWRNLIGSSQVGFSEFEDMKRTEESNGIVNFGQFRYLRSTIIVRVFDCINHQLIEQNLACLRVPGGLRACS